MSRKKKPLPIFEQVHVSSTGAKGKAIARVDGMVIFVSGALPGDVVDVQLTRKKRSYAEGRVVKLIQPSVHRVEPFCEHFRADGTGCGGCRWQDLSYEEQLMQKRQLVIDSLQRIGDLVFPEVAPTLPSISTTHYRNKLEFTFGASRWFSAEELQRMGEITDRRALGFHVPRRFDKVLQVDRCHLQPDPSNSIRDLVDKHARANDLTYYDVRAHEGFLRNLTIRTTTTGETMVLIAFGHEDVEARTRLMDALLHAHPDLASVLWTINPKKNDTIWDLDIHCHHGDAFIHEILHDGARELRFRIGPKTFFQTNPEQTQRLYDRALEFAGLTGDELVYDLYCGAGSISLFMAGRAKRVVGTEIVPEAVVDAQVNAELNGISNVVFEAGDLKHLLDDAFVERHGRPDVLMTDPPRAGMHAEVVARIAALLPKRIVYISCDPATQARDVALLKAHYRITHVQPVDMFPHTYHVENIVRLEAIDQSGQ